MSLTKEEKNRQKYLESLNYTGSSNAELHNYNVRENIDKSNAELFRAADKYGPNSKAAFTLRSRGISYP